MSLNNDDLFIIERNNSLFKVPSSVLNNNYQKNAYVGDSPPPGIEEDGSFWWSTIDSQLYIYYDDGDSSQWVSASPASEGISDAPSDGNVYGRQNSTWVPVSAGGGGGGGILAVIEGDGINVNNSNAVAPVVSVEFGNSPNGTPKTVMPYDISLLAELP